MDYKREHYWASAKKGLPVLWLKPKTSYISIHDLKVVAMVQLRQIFSGAKELQPRWLQVVLLIVLAIAGAKLLMKSF